MGISNTIGKKSFFFLGHFILATVSMVLINPVDTVFAQEHTVQGTVVSSSDGETLPGVNIIVKGSNIGTSTNLDGEYSLTAPSPNDTLVYTFVGYQSQEQSINGRSVIDVELILQDILGEEVVVVGYGTQERRDVTGSVSSVKAIDIKERPITSTGEALQGRISGVTVLSTGNQPGDDVNIRVRGRRSLTASNDPLFVVDGIPIEGNINDINTRDIVSIEVLKDASSTAIYGSRGANGVILVTTDRGGNHPTTVSYSGYYGITSVTGIPDVMDGERFARMKEVSGRTFTASELDALERGVSTDWAEMVLQDGFQQSHQVSLRGGNEKTQFAVSGSFFFEEGVIETQDFNRNTFRVNLDHSVSDKFRIGISTQLSLQDQEVSSNPLAEPFDEEGNLIMNPGADPLIANPLMDLVDGAVVDNRERFRIFSNIFATYDILENLNVRVNFGPDLQDRRRGVFQSRQSTARNGQDPFAQKEDERTFTYTLENIINYTQDVGSDHSFDVTGLFSLQESREELTITAGSDLPFEQQQFNNLGSAGTVDNIDSRFLSWGLMSFMGRINYQFKDKYLLTFTGRYDGSSRLAEGNRWGFFPSTAFAWRINDEPFMADNDLFSDLRMRVSWGRTGNTAIDPLQTQGLVSRTQFVFGDQNAFGFRPETLSNPELEWEVSETINLGIDVGILNDRVIGSFELFRTTTDDLLLERVIPVTSGFNSVLENIGKTRNQGYEIEITSRNVSSQNFNWSSNISVSGRKEKIVELFGTGEDDPGNGWFIGEPLSVWYNKDFLGIWQSDEAEEAARFGREPGMIKVRDVNGDGQINDEDNVILGTDLPKVTLGIGNRFDYRNFDLSILLFGSFGHTIFNNFLVGNTELNGRRNNLDIDFWTPDNPSNTHPKPDGNRERPLDGDSRGFMSGDFLKIRNIQFGYNLPISFLDKVGVRSTRVFFNADQPFIFSNLSDGIDPEIFPDEEDGAVINARTPSRRMFSFGIDIDF